MEGRDEVLSVRDLEIGYATGRGLVRAVRGVSFDLGDDESLAFIGESGSGKTTLGLSLVRLLPQNASIARGEIHFRTASEEALDLTTLDDEALRRFRWRECAMVFQSALNALNPVMRIRDHFADTAKDHGETNGSLKGRALTERATECLQMVQLDPDRVLGSFPHELSGGMRQRVMIALGLLLNPRVLILDEPTTALDVLTQRAIIEVLRTLKDEHRFAMIFVSHDLSLAAELADRVATTYAGRIVELGEVERIFYHPRHPYTVGLLDAVPTLAGEQQELSSIPGSPPDLIDLPAGCKFHPRCPYATERCREEDPPLMEVAPGQAAACWHWEKVGSDWEARGGERHERDAHRA
ncbi:MAG: ABC transporter ATP-binding protein [Actinomycetota bacterium]|nr:ABC transporter ATP-binding protein [Actinomycetota bacterium]HWS79448.1 ABC transporter ATP-binding protein [Rubrobacter sp.]